MNGNFPFKFWCHKVLPLVYDDSISYYEFLCKLAKLVNDISKHNEEQDKAISNNNAYIVRLNNEVHNDIVPHLENEISGLEQTLSADVRNLAMRIGFTPYSSKQEYHKGEYCLYLNETADYEETLRYGIPYFCTQETSGEFDNTAWINTSVSTELNRNYSGISELGFRFKNLLDSLAPNYVENETYNENDIVVYNDKIWICKETTTAGEFDISKWNEFDLNKFVEMNDIFKRNIADEYVGYSGETITYPKYSVVWYNNKLYKAEETVVVDSESVLPPSENLQWQQQTMSEIFITNNWTIESVANDLTNTKLEIASGYIGYNGTPLFYAKDSIVWYNNLLYKALVDITVDSESVLPPDSNTDWQRTTIVENLGGGGESVDTNNIFDAFGVQIDKMGFQINVPKYTIGYTENALNGRQLYYANKDTTAGAGYEPNDWTLLSSIGLYGWMKLITDDINRYNETQTDTITDTEGVI